eukprot:jgi/Mesen1/2485/ME000159S01608
MPVFMFICKQEGGSWTAKQFKSEGDADLTAEGSDTRDLGRKLVNLAVENSSGGGVTSFFSYVSPSSGVYEVNVGGGSGVVASGGGGGAAASSGGAAPAEEKKEEKVEEKEESDDDMGFSLFD